MKLRKILSRRRASAHHDDTLVPTDDWLALLRVLRAAAKVNEVQPEDPRLPEIYAALDKAVRKFERKEK